jgi:hypothetical protein
LRQRVSCWGGPGLDRRLPAQAQTLTPHQQLAVQIFKELVEINTVSETGDTGRAADAMAARLRAAGFGGSDLQVFKPAPRKGNLVARLRGAGARKPILLLAHMDAVPANPEDWSRRMAISTDAAPTTTRPWPRIWWRTSSATRRRATKPTSARGAALLPIGLASLSGFIAEASVLHRPVVSAVCRWDKCKGKTATEQTSHQCPSRIAVERGIIGRFFNVFRTSSRPL